MEPITIATSFASIVSLLGVYRSETRTTEQKTLDEFVEWLHRHRHDQLVELIRGNHQLSEALRPLVEQQHEAVMGELAKLNEIVVSIAEKMDAFRPLAQAVPFESRLSDQAVSILRQMSEAKASRFLEIKTFGGTTYKVWDGTGGNLQINDPRFVEDDLLSLCEFGLLRLDYNASGSRIFWITRPGAAVGG